MENLVFERPNLFKRVIHVLLYNARILKRRFLVALVLCIFIFRILSLFHIYSTIVATIKYKSKNYLYNHGWLPCSLRKDPILFMIDTQKVMAVWETNCVLENVKIQWYEKSIVNKINTSSILEPSEIDNTHYVYKGIIGPITSVGHYVYEIVHAVDTKLISSYFQFFPSVPNDPNLTYPIQIVAFADNQFGLSVFNRLAQLASQRTSPNFIIHAGDGVQEYDNLHQWQTDFYDPLTNYNLAQHAPIIYAHGNHDFDPKSSYKYTTDIPWYSLTIANTRWIVLDSNIDDMNQDLWLSRELSSPETQNKDFKIVIVHIPPFMEFWDPIAWHKKKEKHWGEFVRTRFAPLFRKHGVDLVISGHQHNYQRGQSNGTVYTIIGGAGGELDLDRVEDWSFYNVIRQTHHYILMEIWPDKIIWKAYDLEGSMIDNFVLEKSS